MTPLAIMDDEIQTKCHALTAYHESFRNALFRPEETASLFHRQFQIAPFVRAQSAKQLIRRTIKDIRYLRRIRERMSDVASIRRKRRKEAGR